MVAVSTTEPGTGSVRQSPARKRPGWHSPRAYTAKPPIEPIPRQLSRPELFQRIAEAPSRRHMKRPFPQRNLQEGFGGFIDCGVRAAYERGSAQVDRTWRQMVVGCGYDLEKTPYAERTLQRYAKLAEEIGVLEMHGVPSADGFYRRCSFRLLDPDLHWPPGRADVAQLARAPLS